MRWILVILVGKGIDALDTVGDDTKSLRIRSSRHGVETIRVEIQDHGTGLNEFERIFEPFFTTKKQGMYLAICRSIIESCDALL